MWKITHKKKNGTYVNDEATEIGVALFISLSCSILDCWVMELLNIDFRI